MVIEVGLLSAIFLSLFISFGFVALVKREPWNIELWAFHRWPWLAPAWGKALILAGGVIIILPLGLMFVFAFLILKDTVGILNALSSVAVFARIYAQGLWEIVYKYSRCNSDFLWTVGSIIKESLLVICIILQAARGIHSGITFLFFTVTYYIAVYDIYNITSRKRVTLDSLFHSTVDFFINKVSALPPTKEEKKEEPQKLEEKKDTNQSQDSDMSSIPDEHVAGPLPPKNLDLPLIPIEKIETPEDSPRPRIIEKKIKVIVGDFSTVSVSRSEEMEEGCKKEFESILHKAINDTNVIQKKTMKVVALCYLFTIILYSAIWRVISIPKHYYIGLCNSLYILLFDITVISWGKSKLQPSPVSLLVLTRLLLLGRLIISLSPHWFDHLHQIPQFAIGMLICKSLRDFYFPLKPVLYQTPLKWLELFFHRFEVQFGFAILGSLPCTIIPIFNLHERPDTMQNCVSVSCIIALGVCLCYLIWDRLYQLGNYKFSFNLTLFGIGIWIFWNSVYAILLLLTQYQKINEQMFMSLIFHPIILLAIILYRQWEKNDCNFYEIPYEQQNPEDSMTRQPFKSALESQVWEKKEETQPEKLSYFSQFCLSYIPNTANNKKVCLFMTLFIILGGSLFFLCLNNLIDIRIYSFFIWAHSLYFILLAVIGHINKLYEFTFTNIMLLMIGLLNIFIWAWKAYCCIHEEFNDNISLIVSVNTLLALLICSICLVVGILHFIDHNFEITKTSCILLILFSVFWEAWGIVEFLLTKMKPFLIFPNVVIISITFLSFYTYHWKNNKFRMPNCFVVVIFIILTICTIFSFFYSVITMSILAIRHYLGFIFLASLLIVLFRYIHFIRLSKKHNYHRDIASPFLFPLFCYNPENMKMTSGNHTCQSVLLGLTLLMGYCLIAAMIFPCQTQPYFLLGTCIAQGLFWGYVYDKIIISRSIDVELLEPLNSQDMAICLRRALSTIESTVENHMEHMGLQEIVTALRFFGIGKVLGSQSQEEVDIIRMLCRLKKAFLNELNSLRAVCCKTESVEVSLFPDTNVRMLASKCQAINPETTASFQEKIEAFNYICETFHNFLQKKRKYMAAFLTHIELHSQIKRSQKQNSPPQKEEKKYRLKAIEDERKEIEQMLAMCAPSSQQLDMIIYDSNCQIDQEFDYRSFPKPCIWARSEWMDPPEYKVVVFNDSLTGDIQQGELNDCWVIAAISLLTSENIDKIFEDLEDTCLETGKFTLKLFCNSVEKKIIVEDYFPCDLDTRRALSCQPILDIPNRRKIIWPMLIEKAIAKEYQGYQNLEGGAIDYALMLLNGNPAFRYNLMKEETQLLIADGSLWKKMLRFSEEKFCLGAGTLPPGEMPFLDNGLKESHAYAILDAFEFDNNKLLKLKDPWGYSSWIGDWSAQSKKWTNRMQQYITCRNKELRKRIEKKAKDKPTRFSRLRVQSFRQSSFYISWEDFLKSFEVIFASIRFDHTWELIKIEDRWELGRAGGSSENVKTVKDNPQYLLTIQRNIQIFCLLTQHISLSNHKIPKIGFCIFKYENKIIGENEIIPEMIAIGRYSQERSISLNTEISQGKYVLLLSTLEPGEYGKFTFYLWHPRSTVGSEYPPLTLAKLI